MYSAHCIILAKIQIAVIRSAQNISSFYWAYLCLRKKFLFRFKCTVAEKSPEFSVNISYWFYYHFFFSIYFLLCLLEHAFMVILRNIFLQIKYAMRSTQYLFQWNSKKKKNVLDTFQIYVTIVVNKKKYVGVETLTINKL